MIDDDTFPVRPLKDRDQSPLSKILGSLRHVRVELARLAINASSEHDRAIYVRAAARVQDAIGEIE